MLSVKKFYFFILFLHSVVEMCDINDIGLDCDIITTKMTTIVIADHGDKLKISKVKAFF